MNNISLKHSALSRITIVASAICSMAILGAALLNAAKGIDLIDEGYYLATIAEPLKYKNNLSQFGIVYYILYEISGHSISTLRQLNILITFALASTLAWLALAGPLQSQAGERLPRLIVAAALGTTSLAILRLWLPTPSYNWLALQALMVTAIGLLISQRTFGRTSAVGWTLIAFGGWLAFMAKPTTAAIAGLLSLLYLVVTKKFSVGLVAVVALLFCSLLVTAALLLDGSLLGFVERFSVGLERAGAYGMGHTLSAIVRIDPLPFNWEALRALTFGCLALIISASLVGSGNGALRAISYASSIICAVLAMSLVFGLLGGPYDYGLWQQLFLASIGLSAGLFALVYNKFNQSTPNIEGKTAKALLIGSLPFAFIFGSANNYWFMAGLSGFFWVLSGVTLIRVGPAPANAMALLLPFAFGAQFITAGQILFGIEKPYYQPGPLRSADYLVDLGDSGGTLRVAPSTGKFIEAVRKTADQAGFQAGTPVIDLTGRSPGTLHVMGASSTGQPWLIGNFPGMPGSNRVATQVLKGVACPELARAWLLIEPEGPFRFPATITSVFGADQSRDFSIAGSFSSPDPLSNFTEARTQHLMRPTRSIEEASRACTEAKAALAQPGSINKSEARE
ncbi:MULTISPECIES: hypothetical protein [unclassified Bosea (in: a-proteobacteria)]|uniref:hypothetical protein n=1 Tax=unclassified Bosea (in: a-proteobacteria) TaxID=2653178 RepID=UPI000F7DD44C|nr:MULTISPECIES: hypothetical protein [unclassified Bosea (in: a-proteobacteria)]